MIWHCTRLIACCTLTACTGLFECRRYEADDSKNEDFLQMQQFTCNTSQYHDLATLFLSPPEITIKELYHFPGSATLHI